MRIGRQGQMLAAAGGATLMSSLWLPWYRARLPQSAWQTFTAAPTVLLVTGALVAILSLLELSQRAGETSRLVILAGAVAAILVAYRVAVPPAGASVAWGAYLALAAALAMIAGGTLAAAEGWVPELPADGWIPDLHVPAVGVTPPVAPPPAH